MAVLRGGLFFGIRMQYIAVAFYDVIAIIGFRAIQNGRNPMTKMKKSPTTKKPKKTANLPLELAPVPAAAPAPAIIDAFAGLGGLAAVQAKIHTAVILPLLHPKSVRKLGIQAARCTLLYGPPGTGKAMLARAMAQAADAPFHAITASALLSAYYDAALAGQGLGGGNPIAQCFAQAGTTLPAILFMDEIDILAPARGKAIGDPAVMDHILHDLVCALDGLSATPGLVVIAATHRPNMIDPALLHPGRFDELFYVPVPDADGRSEILQKLTANMPLGKDVDLAAIAAKADRFTAADLDDVVRRAGLQALARSLSTKYVIKADFEAAMADSRASVTAEMEKDYEAVAGQIKQAILQTPEAVGFIVPGMVKPVRAEKHGDVRDHR